MKKQCEEVRCIDKVVLDVTETLKQKLKIPIHVVSHVDVFDFESNEPYCLYVIGNEVHNNFDRKFIEDKNCKAIIKPYPYIPNYSPMTVKAKRLDDSKTKFLIDVGQEDPRVLNLPLGPSTAFNKKIIEKDVNFGFYGQLSGIRSFIIESFRKDFLSSTTYGGFGIDRGSEEYSSFVSRCKVSLVPTGHSPETYRLYEAALAGSALFGTPLPNTEYYRECPIVSIPWQYFQCANEYWLIDIFIKEIWTDLQKSQQDALSWAQKWTDTNFLAEKVINHINTYG